MSRWQEPVARAGDDVDGVVVGDGEVLEQCCGLAMPPQQLFEQLAVRARSDQLERATAQRAIFQSDLSMVARSFSGSGSRIDSAASSHQNVFMRTTLDLPEPLFRELKAHAALRGLPMKQLLQQFVELGLRPAQQANVSTPVSARRQRSAPPTVSIGRPMALAQLSNASLFEILDSAAE